MRYNSTELYYMQIKKNSIWYLGLKRDEYQRVYIPTLDKSFAYDEIVIGEQLDDGETVDCDGVPLTSNCTISSIKHLEKRKNNEVKPKKPDGRFFK